LAVAAASAFVFRLGIAFEKSSDHRFRVCVRGARYSEDARVARQLCDANSSGRASHGGISALLQTGHLVAPPCPLC
jgi:hypothetical protein